MNIIRQALNSDFDSFNVDPSQISATEEIANNYTPYIIMVGILAIISIIFGPIIGGRISGDLDASQRGLTAGVLLGMGIYLIGAFGLGNIVKEEQTAVASEPLDGYYLAHIKDLDDVPDNYIVINHNDGDTYWVQTK